MPTFEVTDALLAQYHRDGYLLAPKLFRDEEVKLLHEIALADRNIKQAGGLKDAQGGESRLWLTGELPEQSMYAAIVRCRRVADAMDRLLGGEAYHYHHKMMIKEPRVGGAWEWHQDYGYWYHNGCLFPHMASCMIAVDRATKANGCLQVLRGSHVMGRIEHGKFGTQVGADPDRVSFATQHLDHIHCELEPGDALFFHSNTLHRSDQNRSENPRWSLICCYNRADNPCDDKPGHPSYRKLEKLDDDKVLEVGQTQLQAMQAETA